MVSEDVVFNCSLIQNHHIINQSTDTALIEVKESLSLILLRKGRAFDGKWKKLYENLLQHMSGNFSAWLV